MFEYSLLGSELKNQTEIAKKQHQRSHKYHRFGKKDDEKINKKITLKNCKETDLINNELTINLAFTNIMISISLRGIILSQNFRQWFKQLHQD